MNGAFRAIHIGNPTICTEQEKETVWQSILRLIDLIQTIRREGLLYLDDMADHEDDVFLRSCMRYITEAVPSTVELREYVSIWLATSNVSALRRLEMEIIGDGLEQMLLQATPSAALRRLGAWLGAEFTDRIEVALAAMKQVQYKSRTESLEPEFDLLLTLSDEQLYTALEQADDHFLALALIGAKNTVVERVRNIISIQRWMELERRIMILAYPRICDVCQAQNKLIVETELGSIPYSV